MKNFKVIVSLVALIAVSNASAVQTVLQKKLTAAVDKIAKNPSVTLSADEKALLSKNINSNDASIKRLKGIQGFDMSQLGATSSYTPDVIEAPVTTTAPAKPLTASQKRAAARAEANAVKKAPAPTSKVAPGPQTAPTKGSASQRAAARREARKEANAAVAQAQQKALPVLPAIPFDAYKYYDKETGLLTKYGIDTLIMNTKKAYPNLSRVKLIAAVHERATDALRPERFSNGRSEYPTETESNQLMAMINREVLETDKQSKSAPKTLTAAERAEIARETKALPAPMNATKPANPFASRVGIPNPYSNRDLPAPQWTAEQREQALTPIVSTEDKEALENWLNEEPQPTEPSRSGYTRID